MNPKHAYSAFLIQYVHDAGSQERLSVGVALECAALKFVDCVTLTSVARISHAFPGTDTAALRRALATVRDAVKSMQVGPLRDRLAKEVPTIFDSGLVLGQEVRGITSDPQASLAALFQRFSPHEAGQKHGRTDDDVWKDFEALLRGRHVPMREVKVDGLLPHTFKHVWKNGVPNAVETLSLDRTEDLRKRAAKNAGLYRTLATSNPGLKISLLVGTPKDQGSHVVAAEAGIEILRQGLAELVEVVPERDAKVLADRIVTQAHEF